jgi:hypothetical protein
VLEVRLVMRGIRRSLGVAPRTEAAPLSVAQLRAMIAASPEVTLRDLRDHCVLLLGFAGALRRSEIAALNWEDISFTEGGLILRLRRSKTDPEAAGQEVGIPRGTHQETDPVVAVERWRALGGHRSGPLFRTIDRRDQVLAQRMSALAVTRILRRFSPPRPARDPRPLRSFAAGRFRHRRRPGRRLGAGHRPADPPPLPRQPAPLHPPGNPLRGERRLGTGAVEGRKGAPRRDYAFLCSPRHESPTHMPAGAAELACDLGVIEWVLTMVLP